MGFPKIYTPPNSILSQLLSPNKGKNKGKLVSLCPLSKYFAPKSSENKRKQSVIVRFTDCFLAGAQGLEPWAYGFGDRRSTNWAIPLYIKRQVPLFLWWALRDSNPGLSGYEPEALTNWAKGPFVQGARHHHAEHCIIFLAFCQGFSF